MLIRRRYLVRKSFAPDPFCWFPVLQKKITVTSLAAISPHPTQTIRNLLGCLKYQTHPSEKLAKRVGGPVEQEGSEDFLEVKRYRTTVEYIWVFP